MYDIPVGAFVTPELTTNTSTVVEEIRCLCSKNVAVHTENCKLDLLLNCSTTTQMAKNIQRMLARKNGVDEEGSSRKAPFVIRAKDQ